MTHRERFQAVLDDRVPDRTPFVARLDIWYNARKATGTLPSEAEGKSMAEIEADLGMGRSSRVARVYRLEVEGVEEVEERRGDHVVRTLRTPVGAVSCRRHDPPDRVARGVGAILVEHFIKSEADDAVVDYLCAHTRFVPDCDAYHAYDAEIGDEGYPLVVIGPSPVHRLMLEHFGYERFFYELADRPVRIDALAAAMDAAWRRMWPVVAQSPARLVLHGVHFSSVMTPPPVFDRYFTPYFRDFNAAMHAAGIKVAFHADADLTGLLGRVRAARFDVADTFACAPLVRTTLDEALAAWEGEVVIWGGVPSIILEPTFPRADFERYVRALHRKVAGRAGFILAVSDNVMPAAEYDRLRWIGAMFSK